MSSNGSSSYVNPKIEELKGSIKHIGPELNTIHGIISSLANTKNCIESSQAGIRTNIGTLKSSIESRDKFNQLVSSIVEELNKMTNELKKLNKVEGIKSELGSMYKSVKEEACSTLKGIQENFSRHETEFKGKIFKYVSQIKGNLITLCEESNSKISELERGIEGLIGKHPLLEQKGKLREFHLVLKQFGKKIRGMRDAQYLRTGGRLRPDVINGIIRPVRTFKIGIEENAGKIMNTITRLGAIQQTFKEEKHRLTTMLTELERLTSHNVASYNDRITDHESHLFHFGFLPTQIRSYEASLSQTKRDLQKVRELKRDIGPHLSILEDELRGLIDKMNDVPDQELQDISKKATEIKEFLDLIKKQIDNSRYLFEYLDNFSREKAKIVELEVSDGDIARVIVTIDELRNVRKTTSEVVIKIDGHKQTLERKFVETSSTGRGHPPGAKSGERTEFFPSEFRIMDELGRLDGHLEKLKAITDLNNHVKILDIKTDLGRIEITNPGTANKTGELLLELNKMESYLSSVKKTIETQVQIIQSSHESNKSKLNGAPNGNGIERMVGEINQIPDKIAELHKSVRIYIQLTQIVSRVIETLDNMSPKAEKLKDANDTAETFKETIPLIKKVVCSAECNMIYMSYIGQGINIFRLKRYIHKLKGYVKSFYRDIESLRELGKTIESFVSDLQSFQRTLSDMSTRIQYRILTLVAAPFVIYLKLSLYDNIGFVWILKTNGQLFPIITYLNGIVETINCLKEHINKILSSTSESSKKVRSLMESGGKRSYEIKNNIEAVESSIESVIICFLKCSNESITNNTKESTKRMLTSVGQVYNNELETIAKMFRKYMLAV